jgi:hypothetical protein
VDVFKHGFRDDSVKGILFEREKMPVADDIYFRGRFDFEVNDIRGTAVSAGTEVQDSRIPMELPKETFHTPVPAWSGVRTSDKEG